MTEQYIIVFGLAGFATYASKKEARKRAKDLEEETGYNFHVLELQTA